MFIPRQYFNHSCISILFYLALLRSTNIGFGYPTAESMLGNISYLPQKGMQIVILMLLLVLFFLSYGRELVKFKVSLVSKLLVLTIGLSVLFSPHPGLSLRYCLSFMLVTLPIYLYYHEFGPEKLFDSLFNFLVVVVVINTLYVLLFPQYGIMSSNHSGAWRGMFAHKNGAGPIFAIAGVFFAAKCWFSSGRPKLLAAIMTAVCVVFVVMSQSSTALIMFVVAATSLIFFYFFISVAKKENKILLLCAYITVLLASIVLINVFAEDILTLMGKDVTLTGRTGLWDVLLSLSFDKPLFGYGLGLFSRPDIMYQYSSEFGWAAKTTHSSYVDIILGVGYVGFALIVVWLLQRISLILMKKTLTLSYKVQLALALSTIFACLINAISASGILLTNSFFWALLLSMILFGLSEEVPNEA